MVHLFYSNQKAMFLALGITVFSLCSCNNQPKQQSQGITQEQLTSLLDSVKKTAKEEAKAELKEEVKAEIQSENDAQSSTSTTSTKSSSSSSSDKSPEEAAYKAGYDEGMLQHTMRLGFYTENNEKQLKDSYMSACRYRDDIGEENYNNRAIYEEYRRGFFKGYEDGNNAL